MLGAAAVAGGAIDFGLTDVGLTDVVQLGNAYNRGIPISAIAYDASRWANEHRDLTLPMLVKYAKLDPGKTSGMRRARYATNLDPRLLQPVLDVAAAYHALEKPVPATAVIAEL